MLEHPTKRSPSYASSQSVQRRHHRTGLGLDGVRNRLRLQVNVPPLRATSLKYRAPSKLSHERGLGSTDMLQFARQMSICLTHSPCQPQRTVCHDRTSEREAKCEWMESLSRELTSQLISSRDGFFAERLACRYCFIPAGILRPSVMAQTITDSRSPSRPILLG